MFTKKTTAPQVDKPKVDKAVLLSKCVAEIELVKNGKLGPMPSFSERIVKDELRYKLIDPFSAQYEIRKPRRGIFGCGTGTPETYWLAPVLVNSKNRLGAYTGWKTYVFTWKEDAGQKKWTPNYFELIAGVSKILFKQTSEEAESYVLESIKWVD